MILPHTKSLEIPAMSLSCTILSLCLAGYPASSTNSVALVRKCSNVMEPLNNLLSSTTAMRLFDLGLAVFKELPISLRFLFGSFLFIIIICDLYFCSPLGNKFGTFFSCPISKIVDLIFLWDGMERSRKDVCTPFFEHFKPLIESII